MISKMNITNLITLAMIIVSSTQSSAANAASLDRKLRGSFPKRQLMASCPASIPVNGSSCSNYLSHIPVSGHGSRFCHWQNSSWDSRGTKTHTETDCTCKSDTKVWQCLSSSSQSMVAPTPANSGQRKMQQQVDAKDYCPSVAPENNSQCLASLPRGWGWLNCNWGQTSWDGSGTKTHATQDCRCERSTGTWSCTAASSQSPAMLKGQLFADDASMLKGQLSAGDASMLKGQLSTDYASMLKGQLSANDASMLKGQLSAGNASMLKGQLSTDVKAHGDESNEKMLRCVRIRSGELRGLFLC